MNRVFGRHVAKELSLDDLKRACGGAGGGDGGGFTPTGNCQPTTVTTSTDGGPEREDPPDYVCGGPDR